MFAGSLLRTHVLRCAKREAGLGEPRPAGLRHRERDPEIGEHRLTLVQQDVLGLDVAMHHTLCVRVVEGAGDLSCNRERVVKRELALPRQPRAETLAAHVRHYIEERAVGASRVNECQNVRVVEPRGDPDLREKSVGADGGGEVGAEHLECDIAIVLDVASQVDRRHSAGTDFTLDAIPPGQHLGELTRPPSEQRPKAFDRAGREQSIGAGAFGEQRLELLTQLGVVGARAIQKRRSPGRIEVERRVEQRRELRPTIGQERSAHAEVVR